MVFDKGYVDYEQYQKWTLDDIYFITRQKDNARYKSLEEFEIPDKVDDAVLKDEKIKLTDKKGNPFSLTIIAFWHDKHQKVYEFITKQLRP